MSNPSRVCAAALLAASLGGCQSLGGALGGGGGVMPDSEVGPPPSMSGALKGSAKRSSASVDDDGAPVPASPTRQLALPKTANAGARTADAGPRRINREDLDGGNAAVGGGGGGSAGITPSMTPSGGMGVGGKF